MKIAVVFFVHFPLVRVRLAFHGFFTCLAAPTGEKTDPGTGRGFKLGDEIGVVTIFALARIVHERRQFQTRAQLDEYILKRFALTCRRQNRHAHRIHRAVKLRNWPIQHRHHIMTLQVSRVRQDQIRKRGRLRLEGIANDNKGNFVLAIFVLIDQHLAHFAGVHG